MGEDGGVATATCIHGYTPDTCLICQTLGGGGPGGGAQPRPGAAATAARPAAQVPVPVRPDAVVAPRSRRDSRMPLSMKVGGALLAMALAAIAVFWIIGIVFAALRLIELVAVAIVAGWAGWKLGMHHSRRQARKELRG